MGKYKFTEYFEKEVLRKWPYLKKDWCVYVIENAVRSEPQEHNRYRFWAAIPELDNRYLRVITLEDAYSRRPLPLIPEEACHPFQRKPATQAA